MTRKGLTLIEMVSIIVVLGLAIPVLLTMWADVAWRSSRSEVVSDAIFYAQQLMEEIRSKDYDENPTEPWTNPGNLGTDGEAYPNFDDVDDFDGYADTPVTGYSRSASVEYVNLSGSNWQTCAAFVNCVAKTDCSPCSQCCFKRITVNVWRTDNLVRDIKLITIVSGY